MTPADERILQLLARWRKSLDLHAGYTRLSDDQYWLVQPWPEHQRPTPWIVDLAAQRLADLERLVQARIAAGDPSLSEGLELMGFLANLVGSQHVQRYIPMAEPTQERPIEALLVPEDPAGQAATRADPPPRPAATAPPARAVATPQPVQPAAPPPPARRAARPAATPQPAPADRADPGETQPQSPALALEQAPGDAADHGTEEEVVRDAVRLVSWGREWHELPAAIARMAGRPKAARIRQILKARRADIEAAAGTRSARH